MNIESLPNDLQYLDYIEEDNTDIQSEHDSCDYKDDDYLSDEEMNKNYSFFKKKPSKRTYQEQFAMFNKLNPFHIIDELKEDLYISDDD